eukprot:681403-Pyramimonas_sp.AAC.1
MVRPNSSVRRFGQTIRPDDSAKRFGPTVRPDDSALRVCPTILPNDSAQRRSVKLLDASWKAVGKKPAASATAIVAFGPKGPDGSVCFTIDDWLTAHTSYYSTFVRSCERRTI